MSEARNCLHCYVSGEVQGVFFRASAQEKARQLGVTGYARNLDDGRVEVFACGTQSQLDKLKMWLARGPPAAAVTKVECEPAPVRQCDDFTTR